MSFDSAQLKASYFGDNLARARLSAEDRELVEQSKTVARVVECEDCGEVSSCPSCDVALTWHSSDATFRCHYCDRVEPARPACAKCGSPFFKHRGSGTQKAEKELKSHFPEGLDYEIVYDTTQFVRSSIEAVVHTLLEAVALVVLVVIIFLQTWRASIIPMLAVPVSPSFHAA